MGAWRLRLSLAAGAVLSMSLTPAPAAAAPAAPARAIDCANRNVALCTEVWNSDAVFGTDKYVGHDEPAALFYSNRPGAGNDNRYLLRLPKDPPTRPNGTDSGGT